MRELHFTYENILEQDLLNISQMRSIYDIKKDLEGNLLAGKQSLAERKLYASYVVKERKNGKGRFHYNMDKAIKIMADGIREAYGNKIDSLNDFIEKRKDVFVFHYLEDVLLDMNSSLQEYSDIPQDMVRFYLQLRKSDFTYKSILEKSANGIPRGQIITANNGDYYYEEPIEDAFVFHINGDKEINNATLNNN